MGNVNMEAYQVHYEGKSVADKLIELDAIAQQIEDLPTFTSNDRVFLEAVPSMPTEEGKKVLTATTDGQGNTDLTYETPDVEGGDIAPVFDDTAAYSEGDLVYYDGVLYKFDADHVAGAWDPAEATQTSVASEFNQLKNTLGGYITFDTNYTKTIDNAPVGLSMAYCYTQPNDAPSGLENWYTNVIIVKASKTDTYKNFAILIHFSGLVYMGKFNNNNVLTWIMLHS